MAKPHHLHVILPATLWKRLNKRASALKVSNKDVIVAAVDFFIDKQLVVSPGTIKNYYKLIEANGKKK
jgi:hypothetical protein